MKSRRLTSGKRPLRRSRRVCIRRKATYEKPSHRMSKALASSVDWPVKPRKIALALCARGWLFRMMNKIRMLTTPRCRNKVFPEVTRHNKKVNMARIAKAIKTWKSCGGREGVSWKGRKRMAAIARIEAKTTRPVTMLLR